MMTFLGFVETIAALSNPGRAAYHWLSDAGLPKDFQGHLRELETRRVLYSEWRYEDVNAVTASLSEILDQTLDPRSNHGSNWQAANLLRSLILSIQKALDTIHGCSKAARLT